MDVEIVPDHHIAGLEQWRQLGGHIGVESCAIDGAFNHPGRYQFVAAQSGDESLGIPFAEGRICQEPAALETSPPERRHVGFDGRLVDEDQPSGRGAYGWQAMCVPVIALGLDISAFFLRRQQRFFYR